MVRVFPGDNNAGCWYRFVDANPIHFDIPVGCNKLGVPEVCICSGGGINCRVLTLMSRQ